MATEGTETNVREVPPLEHTAFFDIDTRDGYVKVDQSHGDRTLYTPEQARDVAESILDAAEAAETGTPDES